MRRKTVLNNLVAPVTKFVAKTAAKAYFGPLGEFIGSVGGDIAGNVIKDGATKWDETDLTRALNNVGAIAADGIDLFLQMEHSTVSRAWLEPLLIETFNNAYTSADIPNLGGDVQAWQKWFEQRRPKIYSDWGSDEQSAFNNGLEFSAAMVAKTIPKISELLQAIVSNHSVRIRVLERQFKEHIECAALIERQRIERQEKDYRLRVCDALDKMELFGAGLDEYARTYRLTVAYISLRLRSGSGETLSVADAERFLDRLPQDARLLHIEGVAGSGKSTLLKWIAVKAARQEAPKFEIWKELVAPPKRYEDGRLRVTEEYDPQKNARLRAQYDSLWRFHVPFFLRLRDVIEDGLPLPASLASWLAHRNGHLNPEWVQGILDAGKVIFFFDGLDEVPSRKREEMWVALQQIATTFKHNRIVLSSRPMPGELDWMSAIGFQRVTLDDLMMVDQKKLVDHWYSAIAEKRERIGWTEDQLSPDELKLRSTALQKELAKNHHVVDLARIPLLCALICAMFERGKRQPSLPQTLPKLCEMVCEMLLDARPKEHELPIREFGRVYSELGSTEKFLLLQALAVEMVNNEASQLDFLHAQRTIQKLLQSKCSEMEAEPFLKTYILLSGLLRPGDGNSVTFIHNTIKEYLAAKQMESVANIDRLTKRPEEEMYQNLAIFASYNRDVGHAIIRRLLTVQPIPSRAAELLALRCLAVVSLPDETMVGDLRQICQKYLPPLNSLQAIAISVYGDELIPRLKYNPDTSPEVAAACLQALHTIGTDLANKAIQVYVDKEKRLQALEVLCEIRNPLFLNWIQYMVHRRQFNYQYEKKLVKTITDEHLREYLSSRGSEVTVLNLSNTSVSEIRSLEKCPHLRELYLSNTSVSDIRPLEKCTFLRELYLDNTSVSDIRPLEKCIYLQTLYLSNTSVSEIRPLEKCKYLRELNLDNTGVSREDALVFEREHSGRCRVYI